MFHSAKTTAAHSGPPPVRRQKAAKPRSAPRFSTFGDHSARLSTAQHASAHGDKPQYDSVAIACTREPTVDLAITQQISAAFGNNR
jgi:hypothetical protein